MNTPATLTITLPAWMDEVADYHKVFVDDEDKMALAIELARQNTVRGSGGPFGAAIFNRSSGKLLSVGINSVVPSGNSVLHAEIIAIMFAEQKLHSFTLGRANDNFELFSSCEPCAMCLGATLWSGIKRLVCAATAADARATGFDEGPVFETSYDYLSARGIEIRHQCLRDQASAVLQAYRHSGALIYNGNPSATAS